MVSQWKKSFPKKIYNAKKIFNILCLDSLEKTRAYKQISLATSPHLK